MASIRLADKACRSMPNSSLISWFSSWWTKSLSSWPHVSLPQRLQSTGKLSRQFFCLLLGLLADEWFGEELFPLLGLERIEDAVFARACEWSEDAFPPGVALRSVMLLGVVDLVLLGCP